MRPISVAILKFYYLLHRKEYDCQNIDLTTEEQNLLQYECDVI